MAFDCLPLIPLNQDASDQCISQRDNVARDLRISTSIVPGLEFKLKIEIIYRKLKYMNLSSLCPRPFFLLNDGT